MLKKSMFLIMVIVVFSGFYGCANRSTITETTVLTCIDNEVLVAGVCIEQGNSIDKKYSLEELNSDFNEFIEALANNSTMLYSNVSEINEVIELQRNKLFNQMSALEFLRVLKPITVAYKSENINVKLGDDLASYINDNSVLFPLEVRLIGDKMYVIRNNEQYDVPVESQIVSINGLDVLSILEILFKLIPSDYDNMYKKYAVINDMFNELYYELIDSSGVFQIVYIDSNTSDIVTKTIEGEIKSNLMTKIKLAVSQPFSAIYRDHYAILTIKTFMPSEDFDIDDFTQFFWTFFTYVNNHLIPNVIIDIRGNSGGNPEIASDLFSYIADYSQPYFEDDMATDYPNLVMNIPLKYPHFNGELVILIDGMVSSTGSQFASLIKSQNIAKFFGTETGGSYSSLENANEYVLKYSKLQVVVASQIWSVKIDDDLIESIKPDFRMSMQIDDYFIMIDNEIEYDSVLLSAINYVIRD